MKIRFLCNCGRRIKVLASKTGKKITCPLCKKKLKIPALNSPHLIGVECECGEKFPPTSSTCPSCSRPYPPLEESKEEFYQTPEGNFSNDTSDLEDYESFLMDSVSLVENLPTPTTPPLISRGVKVLWGLCILLTILSFVYILMNWQVLSDALAKAKENTNVKEKQD